MGPRARGTDRRPWRRCDYRRGSRRETAPARSSIVRSSSRSSDHNLPAIEGFGVSVGGVTFQTAHGEEPQEHTVREPASRRLRWKVGAEVLDLAVGQSTIERHKKVRGSQIAVAL